MCKNNTSLRLHSHAHGVHRATVKSVNFKSSNDESSKSDEGLVYKLRTQNFQLRTPNEVQSGEGLFYKLRMNKSKTSLRLHSHAHGVHRATVESVNSKSSNDEHSKSDEGLLRSVL